MDCSDVPFDRGILKPGETYVIKQFSFQSKLKGIIPPIWRCSEVINSYREKYSDLPEYALVSIAPKKPNEKKKKKYVQIPPEFWRKLSTQKDITIINKPEKLFEIKDIIDSKVDQEVLNKRIFKKVDDLKANPQSMDAFTEHIGEINKNKLQNKLEKRLVKYHQPKSKDEM